MRFLALTLPGAYSIEVERREDARGFFARTWCEEEFRARGLAAHIAQCSISFNPRRGTLRGMHYQAPPHAEAKLIRCTRGRVYDVVLDLRAESPAYLRWDAVELSDDNRRTVYVPEGCAHGFQTLTADTELFYQISAPYRPESARGVRWDDPAFGIRWPEDERLMSERDRTYPDFAPARAAGTPKR
jgi:dTDP-4-dehydrorhamnose 3,5-epimerase